MIIRRWQAPVAPNSQQIRMMFEAEELSPFIETLEAGQEIPEHRQPFDEIRIVASGELTMNVAGNKLLLRTGDKIVIPSNTKHSQKAGDSEPCVCVCAHKIL